jgi:hypothetical protein
MIAEHVCHAQHKFLVTPVRRWTHDDLPANELVTISIVRHPAEVVVG